MSAPFLTTEKLHLRLPGRILCQSLGFSLKAGECWGILGQNGAGKTTLLHTLAGLHPPQGGEIQLCGDPLQTLSRREIAHRLGLMPQDTPDPFPATVLETALIGRHPHLSRWQWESRQDIAMAQTALHQVGLSGFARRQVNTLSGGERRRLALATLLVQAPPVMLLDEPVNHLDLRHQHQVLSLLQQQSKKGHAVIMVLHDINHAARYCDHVLLMFNNGETLHGTNREVLEAKRLSRLYEYPIVMQHSATEKWFMARR